MSPYVSYKDIFSKIDLKRGDVVQVGSDILRLICVCRENHESFDPNLFIDSLLERIGPHGTVLFPTFSFGFCQGETFDYHQTPSHAGGLSRIALERKDFRRTKHPIHSFAVWGRDQTHVCSLDNKSSFGPDSPFGYLYDRHAKLLAIGVDYKLTFPFVHYVEESVGVPYRFLKTFTGRYVDENRGERIASYRFYVRDPKQCAITVTDPRTDQILRERGHYTHLTINGIYFGLVNLRGTADILLEDQRTERALVYAG